jgi:hypothetical protein
MPAVMVKGRLCSSRYGEKWRCAGLSGLEGGGAHNTQADDFNFGRSESAKDNSDSIISSLSLSRFCATTVSPAHIMDTICTTFQQCHMRPWVLLDAVKGVWPEPMRATPV